MTSDTRAQSPVSAGSGISGLGGAILILMFFLPWFSACGLSVSGSDLAFGAALDPQTLKSLTAPTTYPWVALVLLCGIVAVIVTAIGLFVRPPALRFRRVRPLFLLGAGGLALLLLGIVLLSYFDQTTNQADVVNVEYGFLGSRWVRC